MEVWSLVGHLRQVHKSGHPLAVQEFCPRGQQAVLRLALLADKVARLSTALADRLPLLLWEAVRRPVPMADRLLIL